METLSMPVEAPSAGSYGPERRRSQKQAIPSAPQVFLDADGFIQILAHELRGPLAPLRNAGTLLRRAGSDPQRVAQVADILDRQVSTIGRLIDDVMDAFRLRLGHVAVHLERMNLASAVVTAVESTRGFVMARGHELITTLPNRTLEVAGDPDRLCQVIENLVTNAAKYTNHGGHIEVRVDAFRDHAVITVSDDGIGMSAADIGSVFELHGQAGQSGTRRSEGGLGIGLFVARSLVEAHGGTLEAFSAGRGHGSKFVVRLPRAPAAAKSLVKRN